MVEAVVSLIVIGAILGLVFKYVPMPEPFRYVIIVVVVVCLIVWLAQTFLSGGSHMGLYRGV